MGSGSVFALVLILVIVGRATSADFLSQTNLLNMLLSVILLGIVSVGAGAVTCSGHYVDLSIPAIMAMSGIAAIAALPLGFAAAITVGLAAGTLIGAINGWVIGYLRVNPIIWTLAGMSVVDGVIRRVFSGRQIYPDDSTSAGQALLGLYSRRVAGQVPLIVLVLGMMVCVAWVLMNRTTFGARLRMVGSNYEAARVSGIPVRATVAWAFVINGFASAVGGLLLTSLNKVGASYIGAGYDFIALTAVVIGGVTLAGGRGGIMGILGGVLAIGLLRNITSLWGFSSFAQAIVLGCTFILAVGVQAIALRRGGRDDA
jgi:ribose/xylose/arabinose/galactoside ABC-type transport system permease subunit